MGDTQTVQAVARWKSHSDYGLFLPLQYAASVALTTAHDVVRPTVMAYDRRLRVLATGLRRLGWEVQDPQAGAGLWAKYPLSIVPESDVATSASVRVAHDLLRKTGVLVTPGVVFGDAWDGYVRFSAVVTEERMREVVAALSELHGV